MSNLEDGGGDVSRSISDNSTYRGFQRNHHGYDKGVDTRHVVLLTESQVITIYSTLLIQFGIIECREHNFNTQNIQGHS